MIRPLRSWWPVLPAAFPLAACADMSRETWDMERVRAMAPTGHADRRGRDAFNDKLSKKRAEAVRGGLVSIGIDPEAIVVEFKGEHEPAVPTADNVDEPLNRRVEIFIR